MSLPLTIAVIVLADIALIALLAFVMSRASRLTPHFIEPEASEPRQLPESHRAGSTRQRTSARRATVSTPS